MTIDLCLKSSLDFGRTQDELNCLDGLRVKEVEEKGRLIIRFREGFKSSTEIWRGGSIVIHVQPCEDIRHFLQPILDAMVDNHGRRASVSMESFEARGHTGTALLWATVGCDWMGTTNDDRQRYKNLLWWAQDTCELALAAFGKNAPSPSPAAQLENAIEVARSANECPAPEKYESSRKTT